MAKHLHKGDETLRRWKIIDASRSGDASLLPQLLARLEGSETYENRRHVVRALGNIGGPRAEAKLLELLGTEQGLILGDIARALGELGCRRAANPLESLRNHESEWVRQNVTFALRRLSGHG
jgi:HEAT repeat protein